VQSATQQDLNRITGARPKKITPFKLLQLAVTKTILHFSGYVCCNLQIKLKNIYEN